MLHGAWHIPQCQVESLHVPWQRGIIQRKCICVLCWILTFHFAVLELVEFCLITVLSNRALMTSNVRWTMFEFCWCVFLRTVTACSMPLSTAAEFTSALHATPVVSMNLPALRVTKKSRTLCCTSNLRRFLWFPISSDSSFASWFILSLKTVRNKSLNRFFMSDQIQWKAKNLMEIFWPPNFFFKQKLTHRFFSNKKKLQFGISWKQKFRKVTTQMLRHLTVLQHRWMSSM